MSRNNHHTFVMIVDSTAETSRYSGICALFFGMKAAYPYQQVNFSGIEMTMIVVAKSTVRS